MTTANLILLLIGAVVTILGVVSIFFPGITRIINAPGGPRFKSIIAIIIGIAIFIIGLIFELPSN